MAAARDNRTNAPFSFNDHTVSVHAHNVSVQYSQYSTVQSVQSVQYSTVVVVVGSAQNAALVSQCCSIQQHTTILCHLGFSSLPLLPVLHGFFGGVFFFRVVDDDESRGVASVAVAASSPLRLFASVSSCSTHICSYCAAIFFFRRSRCRRMTASFIL